MKKKRVCQVVHSLRTGGAELLAIDFARRHSELLDFYFVCLDDAGELARAIQMEGFPVLELCRKPGIDLALARRFGLWLKSEKIDLIHAHQYTPVFYSALARGVFRYRPPILFTEHGRHLPDARDIKRCMLNQILIGRRDRVVAVGKQVKLALIANEWIRESRIGVVYNGVSVSRYSQQFTQDSRLELRKSFGFPLDRYLIIQVARLNALKDHLTAVRALRLLLDQGVQAHLYLVGEGETRAEIEYEIDKLHLRRSVALLGNRTDIPELLAACDVFLLTSLSEGIPLTLIEAMIAGLPCVATSVGGVPEVIEHEVTGLLSPAGDESVIAKNLARMISDTRFAESCSKAGRSSSMERFNAHAMHAAYRGIYCEMLGLS